jgi:hypothetical protein
MALRLFGGEQRLELVRSQRPVTADRSQVIALLDGLDAFGGHSHLEGAAERHHGANDGVGAGVPSSWMNDRSILSLSTLYQRFEKGVDLSLLSGSAFRQAVRARTCENGANARLEGKR